MGALVIKKATPSPCTGRSARRAAVCHNRCRPLGVDHNHAGAGERVTIVEFCVSPWAPPSAEVLLQREFAGWSARQLAEAANLGLSTVQRVEAGGSITGANMDAIRRALEAAGIEFIAENGGGAGVRMKRQPD